MTPAELGAWRGRWKLSQARAAALLPAPRRTWEDWEYGRRRPPAYLYRALRDVERELAERVELRPTGAEQSAGGAP